MPVLKYPTSYWNLGLCLPSLLVFVILNSTTVCGFARVRCWFLWYVIITFSSLASVLINPWFTQYFLFWEMFVWVPICVWLLLLSNNNFFCWFCLACLFFEFLLWMLFSCIQPASFCTLLTIYFGITFRSLSSVLIDPQFAQYLSFWERFVWVSSPVCLLRSSNNNFFCRCWLACLFFDVRCRLLCSCVQFVSLCTLLTIYFDNTCRSLAGVLIFSWLLQQLSFWERFVWVPILVWLLLSSNNNFLCWFCLARLFLGFWLQYYFPLYRLCLFLLCLLYVLVSLVTPWPTC